MFHIFIANILWGTWWTSSTKYFIIAKKLITTHLEVFSREQLDAHDGEDEPEDDADHQHVEDAGDGLDECVHNDLEVKLLIELIC